MTEKPPTSINDLEPGQKLSGKVGKVELVGAVVDIGLEQPGLVHISQLGEGQIKNVGDVVSEGQEVSVWVRRVDKQAGRIELTMVEPPDVSWDQLKVGQTVTGKVVRLEKFGAFVEIGAERPGLVHVSELAEGYVKSPSDVVSVGDEVEARVIGLSRKKNRIDLSIKALNPTIAEVNEEEEPEESMTAFALAYQRALMEGEDQDAAGSEGSETLKGEDRQRRMQDELLERTLEQHKNREG